MTRNPLRGTASHHLILTWTQCLWTWPTKNSKESEYPNEVKPSINYRWFPTTNTNQVFHLNGSKWDDPEDRSLKFFFSTPTVEIFWVCYLVKSVFRDHFLQKKMSLRNGLFALKMLFSQKFPISNPRNALRMSHAHACPTNRATLWHCHLSTLLPLSQWPDKNSMAIHRTSSYVFFWTKS